jgi:hypothetical protein
MSSAASTAEMRSDITHDATLRICNVFMAFLARNWAAESNCVPWALYMAALGAHEQRSVWPQSNKHVK